MEALAYGLSVFIGLIAGVMVSLVVDIIRAHLKYKNEVNNLRFEVQCNIEKLRKWLQGIDDLLIKINGDRVPEFSVYFNLSLTINAASFRMFQSGELYKCLSKDNIEKLQEVGSYLTIQGENLFNSQINSFKQDTLQGRFDKISAARCVDDWKRILTKCKDNYESINNELLKK